MYIVKSIYYYYYCRRTEYATTKASIEKLVTDGKGFSGENLQEYSATEAKPLVMALNNLII